MEVCGRYHHWMPILIRIVHRDTFLSWCLIYLRTLNNRALSDTQSKQAFATLAQFFYDNSDYETQLLHYISNNNDVF